MKTAHTFHACLTQTQQLPQIHSASWILSTYSKEFKTIMPTNFHHFILSIILTYSREKLLQEQREKERKAAEEAKHEAALKEKQREAEREAHERAIAASRNEDRGHNSPRGRWKFFCI